MADSGLHESPVELAFRLRVLAESGEHELATALLIRLQQQGLNLDVQADVDCAAALLALGRVKPARDRLRSLFVLDDAPLEVVALLGACEKRLGRFEQAMRWFELALERDAESPPAYWPVIRLRLRMRAWDAAQRDLEQARTILERVRPLRSEFFHALDRKQLIALQLGLWSHSHQAERVHAWIMLRREDLSMEEWRAWVGYGARQLVSAQSPEAAAGLLDSALQQQPDAIELRIERAELGIQQGHFLPAILLLAQAIEKEPSHLPLRLCMTRACLARRDVQARQHAEAALRLSRARQPSTPADRLLIARSYQLLAEVESQDGHWELARTHYEAALTLSQGYTPALQGLGALYLQRGQVEKAIEVFSQLKGDEVLQGAGALLQAQPMPLEETGLIELEKRLCDSQVGDRHRASLLFKLAQAWDARQHTVRAFELARKANELCSSFLSYEPEAHRMLCRRIRRVFSAEFCRSRQQYGDTSTLPVFVVGMPRSGTSLVEQILAGHSQIDAAGELDLIPELIASLNAWNRQIGSGRSYPECADDLASPLVRATAGKLLEKLRRYGSGASHVVDKLPHNFCHIGLIKMLLPQARIIWLLREAADVGFSSFLNDFQARSSGLGYAYDLQHIGMHLADHDAMQRHWSRIFGSEIHFLKYEELVRNPHLTVRNMFQYLKLDWESQVLDFQRSSRRVRTASQWQVRQPLYARSVGRAQVCARELEPMLSLAAARIDDSDGQSGQAGLYTPGLLQKGIEFLQGGRLEHAEDCFCRLLAAVPAHAAARFMLGVVRIEQKKYSEGVRLMDVAVARCPWRADWKADLRECRRRLERHQELPAGTACPAETGGKL